MRPAARRAKSVSHRASPFPVSRPLPPRTLKDTHSRINVLPPSPPPLCPTSMPCAAQLHDRDCNSSCLRPWLWLLRTFDRVLVVYVPYLACPSLSPPGLSHSPSHTHTQKHEHLLSFLCLGTWADHMAYDKSQCSGNPSQYQIACTSDSTSLHREHSMIVFLVLVVACLFFAVK